MRKIIFGLLLAAAGLSAGEIYATFDVKADKKANLAFISTGTISEVIVDIATVVKKDDVLAKIQNSDLKALLEVSKTALKYAKLDYDRQLKVKKLIDKAKLDQYAFKYENAKAKLKYQQSLFDKTILKAPFDGVIYEKSIEVGDAVSGAMIRTVFKIQSKVERKLVLEFDQKYWADVKVGDKFSYKVDGSDKSHEGVIAKIYPAIDNQKRKVKAEVKAKDFIVGLFGNGTIITTDK